VEYSRYRSQCKQRTRITYGSAAIAAVVVLALLVRLPTRTWDFKELAKPGEIARAVVPQKLQTQMVIDLKMRGVARNDAPDRSSAMDQIRLPRTALSLSVHLPVGSEDGAYEVALINSYGQQVATAKGEAKLENFVEVLPVLLDLTDLAPGSYQLGIRRPPSQWRKYSVLME
jgi:hypothetical protein